MISGKLWGALLIIFFILTIAGAAVDGLGGVNVTRLNGSLTASAVTANVDSTGGFLDSDVIQIGSEIISYTGKTATSFTGCVRGVEGTVAVAHLDNAKVMSADASIINHLLGFNVLTLTTGANALDVLNILGKAITVTLPKIISADFSLYDHMPLTFFRYVHQLIALGVILPLAWQILLAGISAFSNFIKYF